MPYTALPTSTPGAFSGAILRHRISKTDDCTSQVERAKPSEVIMSRRSQVMLTALQITDFFLANKGTTYLLNHYKTTGKRGNPEPRVNSGDDGGGNVAE